MKTITVPNRVIIERVTQTENGEQQVTQDELTFEAFVLFNSLAHMAWGESVDTLELREEIALQLEKPQQTLSMSDEAFSLLLKTSCYPKTVGTDSYRPKDGQAVLPFLRAIKGAQ